MVDNLSPLPEGADEQLRERKPTFAEAIQRDNIETRIQLEPKGRKTKIIAVGGTVAVICTILAGFLFARLNSVMNMQTMGDDRRD